MENLKFYPLLFILLGFTTVSLAQTSSTATANASATIITPLTIENNRELNFGNIMASSTSGRATVDPNGTRTASGGISFLASMPGTVSSAQFTVNGFANSTYSITLPKNNSGVVLAKEGGEDMRVVQFKHSLGSTEPTLNSSGTQTFTVGARLRVNANQAAGLYTGEFPVTVAYN